MGLRCSSTKKFPVGWSSFFICDTMNRPFARKLRRGHKEGKDIMADANAKITRDDLVCLLNEDLEREYQASIAYVSYSQTIKGAAYNNIAKELQVHAGEELAHAIEVAKQIDYLGGTPSNKPKDVKLSEDSKQMLQFDLENERETIINY